MGLLVDFTIIFGVPLLLLYGMLPLLVYFIPTFAQHAFFLNFVCSPFTDYTNLKLRGIRSSGRNFYLEKDTETSKVPVDVGNNWPKIGVWHVLPVSLSVKSQEDEMDDARMEKLLNEGHQSIILYFHGNSFDRTTKHRCELYNALSAMDFHVLAIDYRGYGDSTGSPSEDGLVEDAQTIYKYARRTAPSKQIIVWGHSMGTGIAAHLVAELSDAKRAPEAVVLEAPFNNLNDVVRNHPFSIPFRCLPWFNALVIDPLVRSGLRMCSDQRIRRITCPIMILHAADDQIIPVELGRKLVDAARASQRNVTYVEFGVERQFKHNYIHRAKELRKLLKNFLPECKKK